MSSTSDSPVKAIAFYGSYLLGGSNYWSSYILLVIACGALGSFIGSYVVGWLNGVTGGSGASFVFMAFALLISAVSTLSLRSPARVVGPALDAAAH
jgi:hypothetical protein